MFFLKVGPQFVFLFAADCTAASSASSLSLCFFPSLSVSLLWQTRRVRRNEENLAGYLIQMCQLRENANAAPGCISVIRHSTLNICTTWPPLTLHVSSFVFNYFLCHLFASTSRWNHLNQTGGSLQAVTGSTGYAACKYFLRLKTKTVVASLRVSVFLLFILMELSRQEFELEHLFLSIKFSLHHLFTRIPFFFFYVKQYSLHFTTREPEEWKHQQSVLQVCALATRPFTLGCR